MRRLRQGGKWKRGRGSHALKAGYRGEKAASAMMPNGRKAGPGRLARHGKPKAGGKIVRILRKMPPSGHSL